MDQVYAMLMAEQKRLKERKVNLDTLQSSLPKLTQELSEIRRENDKLRYEVSIAVEEEVLKMFKASSGLLPNNLSSFTQPLRLNSAQQHNVRAHDMPRQMPDRGTSTSE